VLSCPLVAESGLSNLAFAAILVSAIHPKADVKLISSLMATDGTHPCVKILFIAFNKK